MDKTKANSPHQDVLELRTNAGYCIEAISRALVDLVVSALPSDSVTDARGAKARTTLIDWLNVTSPRLIERLALLNLADDLLETVHDNPTKLGLVGRVPHGIPGKIVDEDELERTYATTSVSGIVVLSLALRRLDALARLGADVYAVPISIANHE